MCQHHVRQQDGDAGVHIEKHQVHNNRSNSKQQIKCDSKKYGSDSPNLPVKWICR